MPNAIKQTTTKKECSMIAIPKEPNDDTRLIAAKITALALKNETQMTGNLDDIAKAVAKHCRDGDGFQMAKDLESAGWPCDTAAVDVLDCHPGILESEHHVFLRTFEKQHDVKPPYPLMTRVITAYGEGVIKAIYQFRPMTYRVKMDWIEPGVGWSAYGILHYFDEVSPELLPKTTNSQLKRNAA